MATRVLVVEDDAATRSAMGFLLADPSLGYAVVTAADGAQALTLLKTGPPFGVILLDLMMPVLDGWSFLWELGRLPGPKPKVIVLTAADEAQFPAGVDAVLRKPVEVEELLGVIRGVAGEPGSQPA